MTWLVLLPTSIFPHADSKMTAPNQHGILFELFNVEKKIGLRLALVGYQFPASQYDDWLVVSLDVTQGASRYSRTDPSLEAQELLQILAWFKALQARELPGYASLSFTEPNLTFHFLAATGESVRISIELNLELKPDFNMRQLGADDSTWNIVFELRPEDFANICGALETAIRTFPVRSL